MKLKPEQSAKIISSFENLKTKDDFLQLLNDTKSFIVGEKARPIEVRQLNYYIHPATNAPHESSSLRQKKRYITFEIKKKSGAARTIHAPMKGLKMIQTCLNVILQTLYTPHKAATGFVPGKSIVDNAKPHAGSRYVYNIDLKDFFPSVDQARVWARLQQPPFNLSGERVKIANMIAALCCNEMEVERKIRDGKVVRFDEEGDLQKVWRNVLPQGAPTSPTITNTICDRLDRKFEGVANRFGLRYTRYADDITFSSEKNLYGRNHPFVKELNRIIMDQNFLIKESKTRMQTQGFRQEVTGLIVNVQPNVPSRYVKQVRRWIYIWEKYGYEMAQAIFLKEYAADKGHVKFAKPSIPDIQNVLTGKLLYLKMVKGGDCNLYKKLNGRFIQLMGLSKPSPPTKRLSLHELKASQNSEIETKTIATETAPSFDTILDLLANQGVEDAMDAYKQLFQK